MSFPLREKSFTRDAPSTTLTPRWPLEFERVPAFAYFRFDTAPLVRVGGSLHRVATQISPTTSGICQLVA